VAAETWSVTTRSALERLERLLDEHHPALLAQLEPGLDDAAVEELRRALAPMLLPEQVEAIYRWRNGGFVGIFGGWWLRPAEDLLAWREFCLSELAEPPTWLQLFDDQCLGFTSLDVPGEPPSDPSVWYGHTHDASIDRLFDSIEGLVDVCADVLEAGLVRDLHGRLILDETDSLPDRAWTPHRLRRCPGTFTYPDPPIGTQLSRFPEPAWPDAWLASLGRPVGDLRPSRPTATITQLLAGAVTGPVAGRIIAEVTRSLDMGSVSYLIVDDGSGQLTVECAHSVTPFPLGRGTTYELDITVASTDLVGLPADPNDRRGSAVRERIFPPSVRGVAHAAWPLSS
jgi:hypothetical protein